MLPQQDDNTSQVTPAPTVAVTTATSPAITQPTYTPDPNQQIQPNATHLFTTQTCHITNHDTPQTRHTPTRQLKSQQLTAPNPSSATATHSNLTLPNPNTLTQHKTIAKCQHLPTRGALHTRSPRAQPQLHTQINLSISSVSAPRALQQQATLAMLSYHMNSHDFPERNTPQNAPSWNRTTKTHGHPPTPGTIMPQNGRAWSQCTANHCHKEQVGPAVLTYQSASTHGEN